MDELAALVPGATVALPLDHPSFASLWNYGRRIQRFRGWKIKMNALDASFDPAKFEPLYFCCRHKRYEDGTHRLHLARRRNMRTVQVQAFADCYRRPIGALAGRLLGLIRENTKGNKKDGAWLAACREKKWVHLKPNIHYRGATVLDVGSHCGYACFAAVEEGAVSTTGIEIRPDLVSLAQRAALLFGLFSVCTFRQGDWTAEAAAAGDRFDIVQCMGLLHYFSVAAYPEALRRLAGAALKILVLEIRLTAGAGVALKTRGTQTLPTPGWLAAELANAGFKVKAKYPVVGEIRQLWICERIK
jgi:hypothetical protein